MHKVEIRVNNCSCNYRVIMIARFLYDWNKEHSKIIHTIIFRLSLYSTRVLQLKREANAKKDF